MPTPIRDAVCKQVAKRLEEARVVVWYDGEGALASVFERFEHPNVIKVDARTSVLDARRKADEAWARVSDLDNPPSGGPMLLVYVPWARQVADEGKVEEPFEVYACIGQAFGAVPAEQLPSLARQALPGRREEIDRLLAEQGRASLEELEALAEVSGCPLLLQALGSEDPVEVAARLLTSEQVRKAVLGAGGARSELAGLLRRVFGFELPRGAGALVTSFARWVLFSEFWLDVGGKVPPHVAQVPHAGEASRAAIYMLCERLRESQSFRETYLELAKQVEQELGLGAIAGDARPWGERDTFAAEDRAALRYVQAEAVAGRLDVARRTVAVRKGSIWLAELERNQLWRLASHCLDVLAAAQAFRLRAVQAARPVKEHLVAYVAPEGGLYELDRCQRWMERVASECLEREVLDELFQHARAVYRDTIGAAQAAFLEAVLRDGWPPEWPRQTQVYAKYVATALQEGNKIAYFLVDAMRYEMGQDLAASLGRLGEARVEAAASVVPTTTPFGMAALVPGAEAGVGCAIGAGGELMPTVGGKPTADVGERLERFHELLGDRFADVRLDDLLEATDRKLKELAARDLIVVRSDDIDKAGEGTNAPSARRFMSSILDDLARAAQRLARSGIRRMVFCADHGHLFVPDIPPGDVVRAPAGTWLLEKRRCRLGSAAGQADGVRVVKAAHLGLHGPVADIAIATGFRVFVAGAAYFHDGLSLQECVVPVVTLAARAVPPTEGETRVEISYKQPRFTTRIFAVTVRLMSLLKPELDVRVVGVAAGVARPVGQAADFEGRDPATGLVRLRANQAQSVWIRIDDEFSGPEVEIQVVDGAGAGVMLGSLVLKNGCLD